MWLARDFNGSLWAYIATSPNIVATPFWDEEIKEWYHPSMFVEIVELSAEMFPEVTFENSPIEVELKIKK